MKSKINVEKEKRTTLILFFIVDDMPVILKEWHIL